MKCVWCVFEDVERSACETLFGVGDAVFQCQDAGAKTVLYSCCVFQVPLCVPYFDPYVLLSGGATCSNGMQ